MATLDKTLALKRLFARVLKAVFTKDELIYMRAQGVSMTDVLEGGYYDDEGRGDGQKTFLSLMSRWPMDDRNDLLVVYGRDSANMITPRKELGYANTDSLLENVGDLPALLVTKLTNLASAAGVVETEREMFKLTGELSDEPSEKDIETGEPVITFDKPETSSLFVARFSAEGSSKWNSI